MHNWFNVTQQIVKVDFLENKVSWEKNFIPCFRLTFSYRIALFPVIPQFRDTLYILTYFSPGDPRFRRRLYVLFVFIVRSLPFLILSGCLCGRKMTLTSSDHITLTRNYIAAAMFAFASYLRARSSAGAENRSRVKLVVLRYLRCVQWSAVCPTRTNTTRLQYRNHRKEITSRKQGEKK